VLDILDKFRHNDHIDPRLHDVFLRWEACRKFSEALLRNDPAAG
jgi:hypothetical protein